MLVVIALVGLLVVKLEQLRSTSFLPFWGATIYYYCYNLQEYPSVDVLFVLTALELTCSAEVAFILTTSESNLATRS